MEYKTLANGVVMPAVGFGVFQIPKENTISAVQAAPDVGYRLIDTAQSYHNEEAVGTAIAESYVNRADIFLTTKVWISEYGYEQTKQSVEALTRLTRLMENIWLWSKHSITASPSVKRWLPIFRSIILTS